MEEFKPVVFRVGNQKFGVDISNVQGIEKDQTIVPVPNTASYIKGIINLRGEVIPVYSLRKKFNISEESEVKSEYIIVWIQGNLMALEVDGVEEIHDIQLENIHNVPQIINHGETSYIDKVVSSDDKNIIIIIEIDKLLTDEEIKNVDKIINEN